jgi:adenylosuccinate synthase
LNFQVFESISEGLETELELLAGWKENITEHQNWSDLPVAFKDYISYLETSFKLPVSVISLGPGRTQTIIR